MWSDIILVLSRHEFIVVVVATVVLGVASGMIGTFSVLRGQSLIGDAVSHSALPGIVLAFIIFQSKDPINLTIGAFIAGTIAYIIIQVVNQNSKISLDTMLAVTLSAMFGVGNALMSGLGTFSRTKNLNSSGIDKYIFGEAAFTMEKDVKIIIFVSLVAIILLLLFYKELKMYVFDTEFAYAAGFHPSKINIVLLVMTMLLIGAGMRIVGAILISSMLIAPGITGLLWSRKLNRVLIIAGITGGVSAFCGTLISTLEKNIPTGASIVVIMTSICLISLIIAPGGIIQRMSSRRKKLAKLKAEGGDFSW